MIIMSLMVGQQIIIISLLCVLTIIFGVATAAVLIATTITYMSLQ